MFDIMINRFLIFGKISAILPNLFNEVLSMLGCPLGLEPCDQKPTLFNANSYAINCANYFYCRSWILPWSLPLHRMKADPSSKVNPVPHDYYLVAFLSTYGYGRDTEGLQERDWTVYFAEYGYAEACPLPRRHSYLSRLKSLSKVDETLITWKPRRFALTLPDGMIIIMTTFAAIMNIRRSD
jgi:hypothetical protein